MMAEQQLDSVEPPMEGLTEEHVKALESVADIFRWNQRRTLSHILIMEEHLKELKEEDIPHAWCLVKHYLLALDHHVEEAIGHAERLGVDSTPYRKYRAHLLELNAYPQPLFTMKELIKLRTDWRKIISDPTLVEDCPLCSADVSPETLAELRGNLHIPSQFDKELLKLEVDYANKLHKTIAKHKGKEKPPFMIISCQGDPTGKAIATVNEHGEPFIAYCAGGVNAHVALHEADHIWRHKAGECDLKHSNCPEDAAESFALDSLSISQNLNTHGQAHPSEGKKKMPGKYEVVGIYGASLVAKGVERGLRELDPMLTPTAVNVWEKASFWGNVALGIGPALLVLFGKKKQIGGKYYIPLMVASAHFASNLLEYAEEQMAVTPVAARRLAYQRPGSLPAPTPASRVKVF